MDLKALILLFGKQKTTDSATTRWRSSNEYIDRLKRRQAISVLTQINENEIDIRLVFASKAQKIL